MVGETSKHALNLCHFVGSVSLSIHNFYTSSFVQRSNCLMSIGEDDIISEL